MAFNPVKSFFKALGIAAVSAGIMFFLGVFLTLVTLLIVWQFSGAKPDLTIAYRLVGISLALAAFVIGFTGSLYFDLRNASRHPRNNS